VNGLRHYFNPKDLIVVNFCRARVSATTPVFYDIYKHIICSRTYRVFAWFDGVTLLLHFPIFLQLVYRQKGAFLDPLTGWVPLLPQNTVFTDRDLPKPVGLFRVAKPPPLV